MAEVISFQEIREIQDHKAALMGEFASHKAVRAKGISQVLRAVGANSLIAVVHEPSTEPFGEMLAIEKHSLLGQKLPLACCSHEFWDEGCEAKSLRCKTAEKVAATPFEAARNALVDLESALGLRESISYKETEVNAALAELAAQGHIGRLPQLQEALAP